MVTRATKVCAKPISSPAGQNKSINKEEKLALVKHNYLVDFRMEKFQTTSSGTLYCSTWNNTPGNFTLKKPIIKVKANKQALKPWDSDFGAQIDAWIN